MTPPTADRSQDHDGADPIAEVLGCLPHFGNVSTSVLATIARASRRRTLEEGEWLFRAGEPTRGFFAVVRGSVKIFKSTPDGREQVLHRLGPGTTFAEAALLTMTMYPANCVATAPDTEVIEIGGDTFLEVFDSDTNLSRAMVSSLSTWLKRLLQRVDELSVSSAAARLSRYLLALPAKEESGTLVVTLPVRQKDLATELGITPETLSRQLRKWKDRGYVNSARGRVELLEPETLLLIADAP